VKSSTILNSKTMNWNNNELDMMWKETLTVSPEEAPPIYVKRLLPYLSLAISPQ